MSLEEKFDRAVKKWEAHCSKPGVMLSSRIYDITDCDAYREIAAMGKTVLPLIKKLYEKDICSTVRYHSLTVLVRELAGENFEIPEEIRGRVAEIETYTRNWLDENINRLI